jgi:hypothetical protein
MHLASRIFEAADLEAAVELCFENKWTDGLPVVHKSGDYDAEEAVKGAQAARVPPDIVARLYAEAKRAMEAPDVVKRITLQGAEVIANSPQEFAAEVKAEYAKWRELVKRPGMKF